MQSLSQAGTTFSDVKQKVKDSLYKADAPKGSLFADYTKQGIKGSWAIIKPPKDVFGIEGLEIDILNKEELTKKSIISQYPVEDKTYIADHISHEPIEITIEGIVGEVVAKRDKINQFIDIATEKLGILSQYKVPFTQSANNKIKNLQAKTNQQVDYIKKLYTDGKRLTDGFLKKNEGEALSRVQNVLQFLYYLKETRTPCNIALNYTGLLKDMFITEIRYTHTDYENVISLTLTFKQVIFVRTETTTFKENKSQVKNQADSEIKAKGEGNGKQIPTNARKSLLKEITEYFFKK